MQTSKSHLFHYTINTTYCTTSIVAISVYQEYTACYFASPNYLNVNALTIENSSQLFIYRANVNYMMLLIIHTISNFSQEGSIVN